MKKDLIAVYLNEHPEFFNEYPELLRKIQSIEQSDIPLEPLQTLSIADRIIKRAHDDKEHMKSRLEWFVEIIEDNEALQERLFEIERAALTSLDLAAMLSRFCKELTVRFNIPRAMVCLIDDPGLFAEDKLRQRLSRIPEDMVRLIDPASLEGWFGCGMEPVLRSELTGKSELFVNANGGRKIESEILIPIQLRGRLAGALCMGSNEPYRFYDGLRTDFLVRTAEKLAIAIDNLLLLEKMGDQPLLDKSTGFYSASFLDIILGRELDQAMRRQQNLSSVKIRIDNFGELTEGNREEALIAIVKAIRQPSVPENIAVRVEDNEYFVLLPKTCEKDAGRYAKNVQTSLQACVFPNNGAQWKIKATATAAACSPEIAARAKDSLSA